jgi:Predicted membrane protein
MDWTWYLFRFEGRINRAKYWLAGLIILCWMIFALTLLAGIGMAFGIGGHAPLPSTSSVFPPRSNPPVTRPRRRRGGFHRCSQFR